MCSTPHVFVALGLTIALSLGGARVAAAQLPARRVAQTDEARPGVTREYGSLTSPRIDETGAVTFRSRDVVYTERGGTLRALFPESVGERPIDASRVSSPFVVGAAGVLFQGVFSDTGTGALFVFDGDGYRVVAEQGQLVGGAPLGPFEAMWTGPTGAVAFESEGALYHVSPTGDVELMAAAGGALPGHGASIARLTVLRITADGEVLLELEADSFPRRDGTGLWSFAPGSSVSPEVVIGSEISGLSGRICALANSGGVGSRFTPNGASGHLMFEVSVEHDDGLCGGAADGETGPRIPWSGLYAWSPRGGPTLVASVVDVPEGFGDDFRMGFSRDGGSVDAAGRMVIVGTAWQRSPEPGVDAATAILWEIRDGALSVLTREGNHAPGVGALRSSSFNRALAAGPRVFFPGDGDSGSGGTFFVSSGAVEVALLPGDSLMALGGEARTVLSSSVSSSNTRGDLVTEVVFEEGGSAIYVLGQSDEPMVGERNVGLTVTPTADMAAAGGDIGYDVVVLNPNAEQAAWSVRLDFEPGQVELIPDLLDPRCSVDFGTLGDVAALRCSDAESATLIEGPGQLSLDRFVLHVAEDAARVHVDVTATLFFPEGDDPETTHALTTPIEDVEPADVGIRISSLGDSFVVSNLGPGTAHGVHVRVPSLVGPVTTEFASMGVGEQEVVPGGSSFGTARVTTRTPDPVSGNNTVDFDFSDGSGGTCSAMGPSGDASSLALVLGLLAALRWRARQGAST